MTAAISYLFLQHYWWFIISLLGGILSFLLFVQGGQSMIFFLPENSIQKIMIINTLGRKWEFTFTTLVTFGGAFFASFPLFYSTSFGGAYWVWIAILFSFTIQAVAYEFRSKPDNIFGRRTFDFFLFLNGTIGSFLIGVAVSTFFTGSLFKLNEMNQVQWATPWYGLEALTNVRNLALGLTMSFLSRVNGILYIINSVDDEPLHARSIKKLKINSLLFVIMFLYYVISLMLSSGFSVDPLTGNISTEEYKYFNNIISIPALLIIFLIGTIAVLYGIGITLFKNNAKGIWFTGSGTILTVLSLFLIAGFANTSFYPSLYDLQSSLTIFNASSSMFTLKVMMYISFTIPFISAYIWYAWRAINIKKINEEEMESGDHKY